MKFYVSVFFERETRSTPDESQVFLTIFVFKWRQNFPELLYNVMCSWTLRVCRYFFESFDIYFFVADNFQLKVLPTEHFEIGSIECLLKSFKNCFVLAFWFIQSKVDAFLNVNIKVLICHSDLRSIWDQINNFLRAVETNHSQFEILFELILWDVFLFGFWVIFQVLHKLKIYFFQILYTKWLFSQSFPKDWCDVQV